MRSLVAVALGFAVLWTLNYFVIDFPSRAAINRG